MASWFLTYKRPMAPPRGISQVVTASHGCVLTLTGPVRGDELEDKPEIGRYAHECAPQEAEALRALAEAAAQEAAAAKDIEIARGTGLLVFGIGTVGKDIDSLASFPLSEPFPPAIARFDAAMLAHAKKMQAHPIATLEGRASCGIGASKDLSFTLALRASGRAPIAIRNPAAAEDDDAVGLQVMLEEDLPPGKEPEEDPVFLLPKRGEVSQEKAPGSEERGKVEPLVHLQPGEELVLRIRPGRHLYASGSYRAYITLRSDPEGAPEDEAVEGSLRVPAGKFSIGKKR